VTRRWSWADVSVVFAIVGVCLFVNAFLTGVIRELHNKHEPVCTATLQDNKIITNRYGDGKCEQFRLYYQPAEVAP
jgi:hypothetical protein